MVFIQSFFATPDVIDVPKITNVIEGIFTTRHNLGLMGGPMEILADARNFYRNVACCEEIYLQQVKGNIYVSKSMFYNPVINSFVSRQITYHEVIYRWNQVSPTGILLQSIILNG